MFKTGRAQTACDGYTSILMIEILTEPNTFKASLRSIYKEADSDSQPPDVPLEFPYNPLLAIFILTYPYPHSQTMNAFADSDATTICTPDIITYRLKGKMVYVAPAPTYEVCPCPTDMVRV